MLNSALVKDVLAQALTTGGDFSELFVENKRGENLTMRNGVLEDAVSGISYGCGLRIFNGGNCIYAYTNDTSRESLMRLATEAAAAINKQGHKTVLDFDRRDVPNAHPIAINHFDVDKKIKIEYPSVIKII